MKLLSLVKYINLSILFSCVFISYSSGCQLFNNISNQLIYWEGDTDVFIIHTDSAINLNAPPEMDAKFIYTYSEAINNAEWSFFVRFDFNPSSSNYCDIYLVADTYNFLEKVDGYFVRIGNTTDEVSLFKQKGVEKFEIIDGTDNLTNFSTVKIWVKVIRDEKGNWKLFTDTSDSKNYNLEGEVFDNEIYNNKFFGIKCVYTSTRSDKFYFDDLSISGHPYIDSVAPYVIDYFTVNTNSLQITFSEEMYNNQALNTNNYSVNNLIGNPLEIWKDSLLPNTFLLVFNNEFQLGYEYYIGLKNLVDCYNNLIDTKGFSFMYYETQPFDIVINEVMADPDPPVGLPPFEYIELFNTTNYAININKWKLKIGNRLITLPKLIFEGNDYIILTSGKAENSFENYGNVFLLDSFPALINTGQSIELIDELEKVVFFVNYKSSWYKNDFKAEGGWSLEMIDPENPCGAENNWSVSVSKLGGTPGFKNSVYYPNVDSENANALRAGVISDSTIRVYFDEPILIKSITKKNGFITEPDLGSPVDIIIKPSDYNTLDLKFSKVIKKGIKYSLRIINGICDCVGNELINNEIYFAIPDSVQFYDIIINEVLFNPLFNGVDYVELYNRSGKIIELGDIFFVEFDPVTGKISKPFIIIEDSYLCFPGDFVLISENNTMVREQYLTAGNHNFINIHKMPSLSDKEGRVTIIDKCGNTIDDFEYDEKMHFPLLNNVEGVSLEKINPGILSNRNDNWHSAAETSGFGTPGYQNSQYSTENILNKQINIAPAVFSPDNDGYNDFLTIQCKIGTEGNVGTIKIFNARGRKVKDLISHSLIETNGSVIWDGTDNYNNIVPIGNYIIFIEVYDLKGNVNRIKKTCVVARKLN